MRMTWLESCFPRLRKFSSSKTEQDLEGSYQGPQNITLNRVGLPAQHTTNSGTDAVRCGNDLAIAFHRAHRVPDDHDKVYQGVVMQIGHSEEPYRLFKANQSPGEDDTYLLVADPSRNASDGLAIQLRATEWGECTVRILAGNVNVASGVKHEHGEAGDYITATPSQWIDGIHAENSRHPYHVVRQFVTTDLTGYSIDKQKGRAAAGSESPNTFHFRVVYPGPVVHDDDYIYVRGLPQEEFQILVKTLSGKMISLIVHGKATISDVKYLIYREERVPRHAQRIIWKTELTDDKQTLDECGIEKEATLHLVLRLRGGVDSQEERSVEIWPGGLIKQEIQIKSQNDSLLPPTKRFTEFSFKVEIVTKKEFKDRTGCRPPPPPKLGPRPAWEMVNRDRAVDEGEFRSFAEGVSRLGGD